MSLHYPTRPFHSQALLLCCVTDVECILFKKKNMCTVDVILSHFAIVARGFFIDGFTVQFLKGCPSVSNIQKRGWRPGDDEIISKQSQLFVACVFHIGLKFSFLFDSLDFIKI